MTTYTCDVRIADPDYKPKFYSHPNEVIDAGTIRIRFNYPLSNPVIVEATRPQWTVKDFVAEVASQYARIYAEEDAGTKVPVGVAYPLLNRNITDGPYGIWGHDIDDLVLEEFEKKAGIYELGVGS